MFLSLGIFFVVLAIVACAIIYKCRNDENIDLFPYFMGGAVSIVVGAVLLGFHFILS